MCSFSWLSNIQQYVNHELPDIQARFRKGRGTRDQIGNICWIIEKVRDSRKHLLLLHWLCQSLCLCGSQQTVKILQEMNTRPPYLSSEEQQGQEAIVRTGYGTKNSFKIREWIHQGCHPTYLTYMQSISCEMQGWITHKLESRLSGEISITSDMQIIPP